MVKVLNWGEIILKKGKKGIYINQTFFNYYNVEELKKWLEEVLKPRYESYTENYFDGSLRHSVIHDREKGEPMIVFSPSEDYDCEKEAKKLCKELNER